MFGNATDRAARVLAAVLAPIFLSGCTGSAVGDIAEEPAVSPQEEPDPDAAHDDGPVDERPPPTHDWDDLDLVVDLSDGWQVRDCGGDAPVRCLHDPEGSARHAHRERFGSSRLMPPAPIPCRARTSRSDRGGRVPCAGCPFRRSRQRTTDRLGLTG